ncbi:amidohydrolase [Methanofollis formosanus]|uniref:Amidohydrolase n=1 Tax=Methanofollis formosanus TaxID=299308 RepID=A0A8G1EGG3_9EURY|nr:amidohydrolase [Methanofollis formosanus]QYZ79126.1 amidohydrolase [Methanofollis formosanus]
MREAVRTEIDDLISRKLPALVALYQDFHADPELSGEEVQTARQLAGELEAAGITVTMEIGGHGLIGVLENGPGPVMMLRADMDALPVQEETGLPYASRRPGVMHACGHDINMTALVGAAGVLASVREAWSGTLLFVGQPAEETVAGARAMLRDGLFTRFPRPTCAVAVHAGPDIPSGMIGTRSGVLSAGGESIDITVRGVGGHAAHPDQAKDPVVIAAETILALQTIRSREISPNEFFVLTVAAVHGGSKHNTIPDEVTMKANLRYHHHPVREQGLEAVRRIAAGAARTAGVPEDLMPVVTVIDESVPPLVTDAGLTGRCSLAVEEMLGEGSVIEIPPLSGSEDFAVYGQEGVPLVYFRVGTMLGEKPGPYLHSSRFAPDQTAAIRYATLVLVASALACTGKE